MRVDWSMRNLLHIAYRWMSAWARKRGHGNLGVRSGSCWESHEGGAVQHGLEARVTGGAGDLSGLLGREVVNLDTPELQRFLAGKRVCVTGAGGSIGSEICRQIMRFCPQRLVLIERSENALFEIDRELRERWLGFEGSGFGVRRSGEGSGFGVQGSGIDGGIVGAYLVDVCDARRVGEVFGRERPQVVFHAAAHKHVPMMELNVGEAIRNNVFGTKVVADAAAECGAAAFVLISTDKAVNPTSVMGATKRMAEVYVQSLNRHEGTEARGHEREAESAASVPRHKTRFVAVRFGNVLGSSGSVVPVFLKQIAAGGPVTVTHPEMRRYFMTIPEASQLVIQAGAIGRGGEIFVLEMGRPTRILDLAEELIRRHGLVPGEDIAIRFTGIRPGEKLHEELAGEDERVRPTSSAMIHVWELPWVHRRQVERSIALLREAVDAPAEQARFLLRQCVPEYSPAMPVASRSEALTGDLPVVPGQAAQAA
jgi:FlaA1/EpsC-like NDP-sugar epimerase